MLACRILQTFAQLVPTSRRNKLAQRSHLKITFGKIGGSPARRAKIDVAFHESKEIFFVRIPKCTMIEFRVDGEMI